MQAGDTETRIRSLGADYLLEKETAAHSLSSCLENSMDREPDCLYIVYGVVKESALRE